MGLRSVRRIQTSTPKELSTQNLYPANKKDIGRGRNRDRDRTPSGMKGK